MLLISAPYEILQSAGQDQNDCYILTPRLARFLKPCRSRIRYITVLAALASIERV